MKAYDFETYDVFTEDRFSGNQLAVVHDASGLTDDQMLKVTREFNLAETTFIFPPNDEQHTAKVRIFTPGYEMPFAGHPTVGTAIAIARAQSLEGTLTLELNAGLFSVETTVLENGGRAEFLNPNLPTETETAPTVDAFEAALTLSHGSIDRVAHQPRRIGAGVDFYFAKADLDQVRQAKVNSAAWEALTTDGVVGVLLYAEGGDASNANYHVRMFAPDAGVWEDAATGSAAAALPGQIARSQNLTDGEHHWVIEQGIEMSRPSRIHARVAVNDGAISSVRIGGSVILVQQGRIFV